MSGDFYFPTHVGLLESHHRENIGPALWEFLWLISKTTKEIKRDGETIGIVLGGKPVRVSEISNDLGISERSVRRNLTRLKKHGYVETVRTPYGEVYNVKNSKKFAKNRNNSGKVEIMKQKKRVDKNVLSETVESGHICPRDRTHMSKRTDRNVLSNKIKKDKERIKNIYVEIIDYLNQKTGKRFSPKSKANQKLINGRIAEGRTLEDFKHVINVKCDEWLNDEKMQRYLRPGTLFRPSNFENYLNQQPMTKTKKQSDPRDKEIEFQKWVSEGNDPSEFNWS